MKLSTAVLLIGMALAVSCATTRTSINTTSGVGLYGEIYRLTASAKVIGPVDDKYESFTYKEWQRWLQPVLKTFKPNAWDCDDMATEEMLITRRYFATFGQAESTPAIGIAFVKLNKDFLGMKGRGYHALNIIHVKDTGWMFYEPQTGQSTLMRDALAEEVVRLDAILF